MGFDVSKYFMQLKPDLIGFIYGSMDKNGNYFILNGSKLLYDKGKPRQIWLHFTVDNIGLEDAKDFKVSMVAFVNDIIKFTQVDELSMTPLSKSKTYTAKLEIPDLINKIHAAILVDSEYDINETSERNNSYSYKCEISWTGKIPGP